ncbi:MULTISPECIES: hypothetical protein [unclassified Microcoleus]
MRACQSPLVLKIKEKFGFPTQLEAKFLDAGTVAGATFASTDI